MDFKNTRISMKRSILDYTKIQLLWSNIIRNNKLQLNFIDPTKKFINVGCGPNLIKNFINLDYFWRPGIELCWDITKGIPLPNQSLSGIYTEHCLEHLSMDDCFNVLREFKRVLIPKGIVRIVVPDAELYLDLYQKNKNGEPVEFPYPSKGLSPMMHINRVFGQHGHLFAYDADTLGKMLMNAGFIEIKKESFRRGREMTLLIDTQSRAVESLYMEAAA